MNCIPENTSCGLNCLWHLSSWEKDVHWQGMGCIMSSMFVSQVWRRPACLYQHHQRSRQPVLIQLFFSSVWRLERGTESHDPHPQHEARGALSGKSAWLQEMNPSLYWQQLPNNWGLIFSSYWRQATKPHISLCWGRAFVLLEIYSRASERFP